MEINKRRFSVFNSLLIAGFLTVFPLGNLSAQQAVLIHSHNDYRQRVPFYQAYSQQLYSIEADVYAVEETGELLVAHDPEELGTASTLDELYIEPILSLYKRNNGRPWKNSDNRLQLLIELKTPEKPTLDCLVSKLNKYPEVFDPAVNPAAVRIVITGNCPAPSDFTKYPSYIYFDGQVGVDYTPEQLERVGIISDAFGRYSVWNGKGAMIAPEKKLVANVIEKVHALGKPIRFWGAPDGITAWNTFHNMGVDIINTDKPEACSDFFHNFESKNFSIISDTLNLSEEVTRTDRLDKTTAGFRGFGKKNRMLTKPVEIYTPTYLNDGTEKPIKNVILLIGDGMGLAQICAAQTVNKGLSFLQCKYVGLQQTNAKDQYTTDSAGAGSSIATGQSNCNRYISMSEDGEVYASLSEVLASDGFACGVVTLGNIADATPAAFYGHATERDNTDEITDWLLKGTLTLLNGSGMNVLTKRKDSRNLVEELRPQYNITTTIDDINEVKGKVICIDERMGQATTEESLPLLAEATHAAIDKLKETNEKGFFLMVEGAKVDYAGHANSLPGSVMETLSFDKAVAEAMKFADSNGETLVIVTADHETGGLTLVDGDRESGHITARYMTDDHTPIMVPVFAYGPGASHFCGIYPNTEIFHKILNSIKQIH